MKKTIKISNIDCANCALKIERNIQKLDGIISVSLNFLSERLVIEYEEEKYESIKDGIIKCAKKVEPDCEIRGL